MPDRDHADATAPPGNKGHTPEDTAWPDSSARLVVDHKGVSITVEFTRAEAVGLAQALMPDGARPFRKRHMPKLLPVRACDWCGDSFRVQGKGHKRKFCSTACRVENHQHRHRNGGTDANDT